VNGYKPYNVINGKEIEVQDKDTGKLYAGEWARDKMKQDDDMIVYGTYKDDIMGPTQPVQMKKERLLRHGSVITGLKESGRNDLMKNISIQLSKSDSSVIHVLDNNSGEMVLESLSGNIYDETVYIDPTYEDSVGLNILKQPVSESNDKYDEACEILSDGVTNMIKSASDRWSPQVGNITETLVNQMIRSDDPFNLVDLVNIIVDEDERKLFAEKYGDDLDEVFIERISEQDMQSFDPILRRIRAWVKDRSTRQILANDSGFDLYEAIKKDKNVVFDTSNIVNDATSSIVTSAVYTMVRCYDEIQSQEDVFVICDDFRDKDGYNSETILECEDVGFILFTNNIFEYSDKMRRKLVNTENFVSFCNEMDDKEATKIGLMQDVEPERIIQLDRQEFLSKTMSSDGYMSDKSVKGTAFYEHPPLRKVDLQEVVQECSDQYKNEEQRIELDEYGPSRFA
jgi:hypothetical protein